MVNLAIRAALHAGTQPKDRGRGAPAIAVFLVLGLTCGFSASAQTPLSPGDSGQSGGERVHRLQDSLATGKDWDISMPAIDAGPAGSASAELSFVESVRAGSALNSEAYLALDRELRQVRQRLQDRPADAAARRQLADLRRALIERIEVNLRLEYLYAATVYVELLRQADGPAETVQRLSQRLVERRAAARP